MISYAHKDDPEGVRFCQYKKDKLPPWAIDVQPYEQPDTELPGMWENADFIGGETDVPNVVLGVNDLYSEGGK